MGCGPTPTAASNGIKVVCACAEVRIQASCSKSSVVTVLVTRKQGSKIICDFALDVLVLVSWAEHGVKSEVLLPYNEDIMCSLRLSETMRCVKC
jgi:hypothetical protein